MIKLLLTSSGITNPSIHQALVDLLGKPASECNALFIPTAIYPFAGGAFYAGRAIYGNDKSPLTQLGWKSFGLLELTALPSIDKAVWAASVEQADVLLAWGGDPLYLAYWLQNSGLTELLGTLGRDMVYVGVSAGSMAVSATFAETYTNPPSGLSCPLSSEEVVFTTPQGEVHRTLVTANGAGLADFALIPHFMNQNHPDASETNAAIWAAKLDVPVYAIDDQTAIKVSGNKIEIISEGYWQLFNVNAVPVG